MNPPKPPPPALMTQRILWLALLTSNFLYVGVLFYLRANRGGQSLPAIDPTLAPAFAVVALGVSAASLLLPRRLYASFAASAPIEIRDGVKEDPMGALQGFRRPAPSERLFADADAARRAALLRNQSPFIVGMALAESVSLLGFVLGFLGAGEAIFLPFFAVGIALQATRFPTMVAIERAFEAAHGAKFFSGHTSGAPD
ncbi:MAG: hypothetical protein EPO40_10495 [Myxococcaceae bacterium]|nr:MAG: hypothetical protein EPO40_10495 [Myxococcaceae bacterium]